MSLMPQTPFQWFVPATTGTGMVPAAGYLVKFYSAGTTTPKTIYTDPDLAVPYSAPANTAFLDANGRALIYLGAGGYKMVVCKPDGTPEYAQDNIVGEGSFGTGFVNSFADLQAVNTTIYPYTYIGGYYEPGDGGHGMFYNAISGTAADGGYVQDSTFDNTKKWFRIPDEDGMVRSASFGAISSTLADNNTSEMLAASAYAANINATLLINVWAVVGSMAFSPTVRVAKGAYLEGVDITTSTYTFNGIFYADADHIFRENTGAVVVVFANDSQESRPEWFGAALTASAGTNATAFAKWLAAGAGLFIVTPGSWPHTGAFTPSATSPTFFYGSVGGNAVGAFYPVGMGDFSLDNAVVRERITFANGHYFEQFFGAGVQTDADFQAGGNVQAGGDVVADENVTANSGSVSAGTSVTAGTSVSAATTVTAGSYVEGSAGTVPVRISGLGASIVGTGLITVPAGTLQNNGEAVRLRGRVSVSGGIIAPTILLQGVTIFGATFGSSTASSSMTYEVTVFRTGATSFVSEGTVWFSANGTTGTHCSLSDFRNTGSITWANSAALNVGGTGIGASSLSYYEIFLYNAS